VQDGELLEVLGAAASAVHSALGRTDGWRRPGGRPGQYHLDLVADAAALAVLHRAGLTVLSEESGVTGPTDRARRDDATEHVAGRDHGGLLVVLDPVDGSTNASLGLPWYATSLCVLDDAGPRVALVVNQASGTRYEAIRGGGATRDGTRLTASGCRHVSEAVIGISGYPDVPPRWAQFRALGAAALDLCAVAEGVLDGYLVGSGSSLYGWDYLGGILMCAEAGSVAVDASGEDLVVRDSSARAPVVAATPELLDDLLASVGRRAVAPWEGGTKNAVIADREPSTGSGNVTR
jgi:fructose-1,6-bisphosphatase/inositol monophosphatase family enzyme